MERSRVKDIVYMDSMERVRMNIPAYSQVHEIQQSHKGGTSMTLTWFHPAHVQCLSGRSSEHVLVPSYPAREALAVNHTEDPGTILWEHQHWGTIVHAVYHGNVPTQGHNFKSGRSIPSG